MVMHFVWIFSVLDCQHYTFIFPWYMVLLYKKFKIFLFWSMILSLWKILVLEFCFQLTLT